MTASFACIAVICLVVGFSLPSRGASLDLGRTLPRQVATISEVTSGSTEIDATVSLRASLFNKVLADVVPIVDLLRPTFRVPGINDTHFAFDSFNLTDLYVGGGEAEFESPSTLSITLSNFGLDIPPVEFLVRDTLLGIPITCQGSFWGNASQTSIDLALSLETTADGVLSIVSVTPNVSFGNLFVNHTIDGSFCQSLVGIIRDFIGSLNKFIEKLIKEDLPSKLGDIIMTDGNKAFAKLPFKFVTQPEVSNDTLALDADIGPLIHSEVSPAKPPRRKQQQKSSKVIPFGDIFTNRDLSITLGHHSLDNLLAIEIGDGKLLLNTTLPGWVNTSILRPLFPIVYRRCPACPLSFDVFATQPPVTSMWDDILSLNFTNLLVGINAYNVSANTYTERIFDLGFNITLEVYDMYINDLDSKLFLHINIPTFAFDVYKSVFGPVNVAELSSIVNYLIVDIIVPIFNMAFPGVDVKLVNDGVGLSKVDFEFFNGALTLGADLVIPKI